VKGVCEATTPATAKVKLLVPTAAALAEAPWEAAATREA